MKFNKIILFYKIHKFLEDAVGMTSAGSRTSKPHHWMWKNWHKIWRFLSA